MTETEKPNLAPRLLLPWEWAALYRQHKADPTIPEPDWFSPPAKLETSHDQ